MWPHWWNHCYQHHRHQPQLLLLQPVKGALPVTYTEAVVIMFASTSCKWSLFQPFLGWSVVEMCASFWVQWG